MESEFVKLPTFSKVAGPPLTLICPHCKGRGTFQAFPEQLDIRHAGGRLCLGQRKCPNPACHLHVFCVFELPQQAGEDPEIRASYPAARIPFDTEAIPEPIVATMEEAITCHANKCYVASAMMVRKTLEELCEAEKVKGKDLHARLEELKGQVVLPEKLFEAIDELRLLGNDAAHIESRDYDDIGREEVEISVEFASEILKAIYQYKGLIERLRSLKKKNGGG